MYGEPGSGKTHLCGTAADEEDTRPILLIDVEGGSLTLRKRQDVDVLQVRRMSEVEATHNELFRNPGYYKTVIIDSLTELQKLDMRHVTRYIKEHSPNPDRYDDEVPDQRAWGKSGVRMSRIVRAFKDLPCNTIMTCLLATEQEKNEKGGETDIVKLYYPSLPGKLRSEIPGYFDIVGFLKAEADQSGNIKRSLQVAKTKKVIAKDRTASLGLMVNEPSVPLLWTMIHSTEG
jgi:phage nucleotide-binding protein